MKIPFDSVNNFTDSLELWDESLDVVKDSDMKARIQGVHSFLEFL